MEKFSKIQWIVALVVLIFLVGGSFVLFQNKTPKELPKIRIGIQTAPAAGLIKIALEKGFFKEEGLDIEVKEFTGGKFALQAMVGGSLDLVTPAELPITLAILNGEKISILSKVNETLGGFPMILRKEGETFNSQTYFAKKKKIATFVGGGPEFFTADFFKKYNIQPSQYEIVSMKPEDMPIALANNSVDGVAIFEPFAHFAIQQTGTDKIFSIKSDDLYAETIVLAGKTQWMAQNEKTVAKFLQALQKAEKFIKENPQESINIIAGFTKLDQETLTAIWPTFTFDL
ncbi:MAG: NrtA/SsuA/CpmA family ABC transporter substrate-binding protein, partial [Patescibacteria group bacterium]